MKLRCEVPPTKYKAGTDDINSLPKVFFSYLADGNLAVTPAASLLRLEETNCEAIGAKQNRERIRLPSHRHRRHSAHHVLLIS